MTNKLWRRIANLVVVLALTAGLMATVSGCGKKEEGPAEKAGKQVDKAAEKAGEAADKATDQAGKAVEKAGEAMQDAAK